MSKRPRSLSGKSITAYNRLSVDLAALNYVLRINKPSGVISEASVQTLNAAIDAANRLFCREPALPRFVALDPQVKFTAADFAILVTRLSGAAVTFEGRYLHLTKPNTSADTSAGTNARRLGPDGLPSPHR
ncbi:hypothetical protein [Devosia sp. A449]